MTATILRPIFMIVDATHSTGKTIVVKNMITQLIQHFGLSVHRSTVGQMMNMKKSAFDTYSKEKEDMHL